MSILLLDASVILAAFDSDDALHKPSRELLVSPEVTLATLDLARYEVANVAVRAWREPAAANQLLDTIDRIAGDGGIVAATTALLRAAVDIAEKHAISAYDASYVAAADQVNATLVSCDGRDLVGNGLARDPEHVRR